jgi:geranylgeranyl reductase family protein
MTQPFNKNLYDVCIIGAGPAGSSAAILLARRGYNILLLDKEDFPREKVCGDCITPPGVSYLLNNGLLEPDEKNFFKLRGVKILTSKTASNVTDFNFRGKYPDYALTIPRKKLDHFLTEKAIKTGVSFHTKTKAVSFQKTDKGFTVFALQGTEPVAFSCKTLIVACGNALSFLQKNLGLKPWDYGAVGVAIRAYFDLAQTIEPYMSIIADHELWPSMGWIFPVSERTVNVGIGFYLDEKHLIKGNLSSIFGQFVSRLSLTSFLLENAKQITLPRSLRIFMGGLKRYPANSGILLCGEAAGLVNPFTGEGIAPALRSGILAVRIIDSSFASGKKSPELISLGYYRSLLEEFGIYLKIALFMKRLATKKFVTFNVIRLLNLFPSLSQFNIHYWVKA